MANENKFPESPEKNYLRHWHLRDLAARFGLLDRPLAYLGLPSAEMHDVKLWRPYLGTVTAIERDRVLAMYLYQTATRLGIRNKMIVLERELAEVARLLAMEERDIGNTVIHMFPEDQEAVRRARNVAYDIINLDMYGGFIYVRSTGNSENAQILIDLIKHQARHRTPFTLALTFNLRDTGRDDYDDFIEQALAALEAVNFDTAELRNYYLSPVKVDGQSRHLIRLRFCVPTYIHKIAFDQFDVRSRGAWTYKHFYHISLQFEPRLGHGTLGLTWPPIDEFNRLLATPLQRLKAAEGDQRSDEITATDLPGPTVHRLL